MGNIRKQIEKGYADLRRSEKLAADYVLEHMGEIPDLSIDRLAHNAGVSQPTVLRMLRSAGFSGYRDFCYRLVAELAKKAGAGEGGKGPMYGYTLDKSTPLEEIPFNMAATTQKMLEETIKSFSGKIYQKTVEALANARLIDIYGVENSEATALDALPVFQRLLSPADRGGSPDARGCGGGDLLFRGVKGYRRLPQDGEKGGRAYDRGDEL